MTTFYEVTEHNPLGSGAVACFSSRNDAEKFATSRYSLGPSRYWTVGEVSKSRHRVDRYKHMLD